MWQPHGDAEACMDCLWLTLAYVDPPTNGQLIYSKGLMDSVARAGVRLTSWAMRPSRNPPADLRAVPLQARTRLQRVLSADPVVGAHGHSIAASRAIGQTLASRRFDVVVFDSISAGWALSLVEHHRRTASAPPRVVYLAHNHEITVARRIVQTASGPMRLVRALEALKVIRLERRLIAAADLLTSNTPEDCHAFAAEPMAPPVAFLPPGYDGPRVRVAFLPPGYDGPRVRARLIDASTPRRVVIVGSFDWQPKRTSLESFLQAGALMLARAGIGLQVVGAAEESYLAGMRQRFPTVEFTGPVDDVRPYMAQARIALVPDQLGGFKLKGLDYVFARLPILAMRIALPGMPLQDSVSFGLFDSHAAMAEGIVALIDDFATLNARHERAYAACDREFDWDRIGRSLVQHIREAEPRRSLRGPVPIVEGAT
jgi:glycosyltransferase involved in cell wall biosynthesis